MTTDTVKSAVITNLDATPIQMGTGAEGRGAHMFQVDDTAAATAAGIADTTSTYRLCRFPTQAIVKEVVLWADALDTDATPTLALEVNVAFSDATTDGTPSAYQGLLPSATLTGVAPVVNTDSGRNKLFGTLTLSGTAGGATNYITPRKMTFGVLSAEPISGQAVTGGTYTVAASRAPLWNFFGYVDGKGQAADPGGYFDLYVKVTAVAKTGAAGNINAKLTYAR